MTRHKFQLGKSVHFVSTRGRLPASNDVYRIVRLMPIEGIDATYRIKSAAEAFERVARESELVLV